MKQLSVHPTQIDTEIQEQAFQPDPSSPSILTRIRLQVAQTIGSFRHVLRHWVADSAELRVWQTTDPQGRTTWHAYDPVTGLSTSGYSEDGLRAWVDQRYYLSGRRSALW